MNQRFIFFAALFLFTLVGCRKDGDVGLSLISDDLSTNYIDTFTLDFSTVREDSVRTKNNARHLLGELNDPEFGKTSAFFTTQIVPATALTPNFTNLQIDSAFLSFPFTGYFGDTNSVVEIKVYELNQKLSSDSNYSQFTRVGYHNASVGQGTFQGIQPTVNRMYREPNGSGGDTTLQRGPMLRIPIDSIFAKRLLTSNKTATAADFVDYCYGLRVEAKVTNSDGLIIYLGPALSLSGLNIYYHDNGLFKRYDFNVASTCVWQNSFDYQFSGSNADISSKQKPYISDKIYVEGMAGYKTRIQLPYLRNLLDKNDLVIQKAVFEFPVHNSQSTNSEKIPTRLSILSVDDQLRNNLIPDQFASYFDGNWNETKKVYSLNVTQYLQDILYKNTDNGFYLISYRGNMDGTRLLLNSNNSTNPPKLKVIFTKINK